MLKRMAEQSPLACAAEIYTRFDKDEARLLEIYKDDVERLVGSQFFQGPPLSLTVGAVDDDGDVSEELEGPSEESVRAIANLLRSLYDNNEPTSYNTVLNLLLRHAADRDSATKKEVIRVLRDLKKSKARVLDSAGLSIKLADGEELTTAGIIKLVLYSQHQHKDLANVAKLDEFALTSVIGFEFMAAVQRLARVFWNGRNIVRTILAEPSLMPAAE